MVMDSNRLFFFSVGFYRKTNCVWRFRVIFSCCCFWWLKKYYNCGEISRRLVLSFLSYRDCAKIMQKFSIYVHHTMVYRWCQQYGKVFYHLWKKRNKRRALSQFWWLDETYVKVKGKDHYLYRTIESNGNILDMWLRNHRGTVSTKAFMKWLIRDYGQPRSIVINAHLHWKPLKNWKKPVCLIKKSISGSPTISIMPWNRIIGRWRENFLMEIVSS